MKETYGVPVEEIQEGIKNGVRKINIDTDIRLAMTGAIRRFFVENPAQFDRVNFWFRRVQQQKKSVWNAIWLLVARARRRRSSRSHWKRWRQPTDLAGWRKL